jgi:ribose transport system permease protein
MAQAGTTTIDGAGSTRGRSARARAVSIIQRQGALVALALVCGFAAYRYPQFLSEANLTNVLRQNSMLGLVALGMTFVILTGGIDLSVGSLLAVAGVVAAHLAGRGLFVALVAGVGLAALLGLANGVIIARARVQPFIVTLAMMIAARGLALVATGEQTVRVDRSAQGFTELGRGTVDLGPLALPVPVIILVAAYVLGWLVLNHTRFGRHVFSIGDNEEAARLMGLNVRRVTVGVYALSGALAGLAGVILASRLGAGQPVAGQGWEREGKRRLHTGRRAAARRHLQHLQPRRQHHAVVAAGLARHHPAGRRDRAEPPEPQEVIHRAGGSDPWTRGQHRAGRCSR